MPLMLACIIRDTDAPVDLAFHRRARRLARPTHQADEPLLPPAGLFLCGAYATTDFERRTLKLHAARRLRRKGFLRRGLFTGAP